jgi:hypothetical protein
MIAYPPPQQLTPPPAAETAVTANSQALDAGTVVSPKLCSLKFPAAVNAKKSVATTDRVAAMNLRKRSISRRYRTACAGAPL